MRQGIPRARQLPKKISAKLSPISARIPQRIRAWGACSRLEPQPKLSFTTRIVAPWCSGRSKGWAPASSLRSSAKAPAAKPSKLTHLRKRAGMIRSVSMSLPTTATARPARQRTGPAGKAAAATPMLATSLLETWLPEASLLATWLLETSLLERLLIATIRSRGWGPPAGAHRPHGRQWRRRPPWRGSSAGCGHWRSPGDP